ncbi:acetyl-CoA acetyltransferase [Rhodococcus sp. D2-41]|uniref:Acetyl-CoA acetyltransferase n=1 Tax=Speluncibacter jeojiensis TaxID=2710754 RepID=A0A9X4RBY9_9ACTN|nr:acetyl-CoA acetyltransferase [Rhodococcus sp. D2-41]MDG3008840.1 acetyl-CoA acetyltransferase [Rhodococcus sp. D2-41]MDG3012949.1 acetyl-CoA acetyltransferase [Corynebacteriales bacterium D3-21]
MTPVEQLDPRTPVLVGVGQYSERIDDADYRALSAVALAAEAASAALADTGGDVAALAAAVDTVGGIRQFEISTPVAWAPLGRSNNYPRSVAARVGADPAGAVLEVVGGQGPQHLVSDVAGQIAAGDVRVALLFGSEAISTVRYLADAPDRPDFTETIPGDLEDRGLGIEGLVTPSALGHGLTDAACQYAMLENARRARLGRSRAEYARGMGELFAPFTRVAAGNPHAAAPTERDAAELAEPSPQNRVIADPYTRYLVARDQVNQGAAVLIMSVGAARELGIGQDRWVFLHGRADLRERELLERQDLGASPASVMAARSALDAAGITVADLSTIDLYSCFPIAVSNVADGLGLGADDPRGLTVTGGLPFFGGAGNNYSMHAIAETVDRCRKEPGSFGFVGANGGILSKYSAAVYSTTPTGWPADRSAQAQAEIDGWPAVASTDRADGWATVDTYTVKYAKDDSRLAIVIGRLEATGERFYANEVEGDTEFLEWLTADEPIGRRVYARSVEGRNRVTLTEIRMNELGVGVGERC